MTLFLSLLIAMFVTMVLIPPLMRTAERLKFVDLPGDRKVHAHAVPRIGGIAMVVGAVFPIMLWLMPDRQVIALLVGMGIILAFGVGDDRLDLDYRIKFFGQALAACVVVFFGDIRIGVFPLFGIDPIAAEIAVPVTIFFLLAVTNAINLSDGLDGLAGGTAMLSLGMITLLGYLQQNMVVVLVALAVIGSILGFLRFNTYPARIFMGDGGSQFLGFALGVLTVMVTMQAQSAYSPVLAALLLGFPLLDTAIVMVQRIAAGRSPFAPDKNHVHHKLLVLGLDHYEAVFVIYLLQAGLVLLAYFLRFQTDEIILGVYLAFCLCVVGALRWAQVRGWSLRAAHAERGASPLSRHLHFLRNEDGIALWAAHITAFSIFLYVLVGVSFTDRITVDIGVLALLLACATMASGYFRRDARVSWVDRVCGYTLLALVVYLVQATPGPLSQAHSLRNALFFALAIVIAIGFRFATDRVFRATTLDFLVIFLALTIPNLTHVVTFGVDVGETVAKIVVLFYGIELVFTRFANSARPMRRLLVGAACVLALRALLQ